VNAFFLIAALLAQDAAPAKVVATPAPERKVIWLEPTDPNPGKGCWLSEANCLAMGKEVTRLRTENADFQKPGTAPDTASVVPLLLIAAGAGFVAGGFAVLQLKK
jgi:hypothetical protein